MASTSSLEGVNTVTDPQSTPMPDHDSVLNVSDDETEITVALDGPQDASNVDMAHDLATHAVCHTQPMVVLVGPPGAGKSTIGRRLARALSLPLVDSDQLIEEAEAKTCGEVFSELGEPAFRELEAEHVARALMTGGVVSLGGGAVLTESTRELLANHTVVWIDVSPEEGVRRTVAENTRPVLAAADPEAHYRNLLDVRAPLYRGVADHRVRTDQRSPQQSVADILNFLETI